MPKGKSPMTPKAASRIQSAGAKNSVNKTATTNFASRAQSSGEKNSTAGKTGGKK